MQVAADSSNDVNYGIEYDWTNFDDDMSGLTGLDFDAILLDIMDAADEAGFDLVLAEVASGSTNFYVDSSENHTATTITGYNGSTENVSMARTSTVTLRHGVLLDTAVLTNWTEANFGSPDTGFSIQASADSENSLIMDAVYVEYFDENMYLLGADMDMSMSAGWGIEIMLDATFEGNDSTIDLDVDAIFDIGISVDESSLEWRLEEPSPIYVELANSDELYWDCNDWYNDAPSVHEDQGWGTEVNDLCGSISGDYTSSAEYTGSLTGLPTEHLGLAAGHLDVSFSDMLSQSRSYTEAVDDASFSWEFGETHSVDLGDGETTSVRSCYDCAPINPLMDEMLGYALENALEDVAESLGQDLEEEQMPNDINDEDVEPSQDLMNIAESLQDSNLQGVLQEFGELVEGKMMDYEASFPYEDGEGHVFWSDQHGTVVGFGAYVMDSDGNWYTWFGPSTAGYADEGAPAELSITYLTGVAAEEAEAVAEEADSLEDLAPEEEHDLSGVAEAIEAAGGDPADFGLEGTGDGSDGETNDGGDTNKTAEELIEEGEAGLLPFISPVSVVTMMMLAAFAISRREDE